MGRDLICGDSGSAAAQLFDLQIEQLRHDETYHREITRLTVHARINHMALHFSKYVGQMAEAVASQDFQKIKRTIVDTFIINLCTANALNIRLSSYMPGLEADRLSLFALPRTLVDNFSNLAPGGIWLVTEYAVEAGKIAKACEKIDHLEAYPFKESIAASLGNIGCFSLTAARAHEFELVAEVRRRLEAVEKNYLFHNVL